jgi:protocatechuate 3,4-dioxygenase beta subunit
MADVPLSPRRRRLLAALALAPLAPGLVAPAWGQGSGAPDGLCLVAPELAEGPFYLAPPLRAEIAEGRPGAALELVLQIVDAACRPVAGARVDVWQCDALGVYSGVRDARSDTRGQTFLRGAQVTDADGVARFRTIYPGWYAGRTPHVHYKAWLDARRVLTSQLFLPDALSERVYAAAPYAERRGRRVLNAEDRIAVRAGAGAVAAVRAEADRYVASLVVGVDPDAPAAG